MKIQGFTLIELVFTMTMVIMLVLISSVGLSYLHQKNEQQTIVDELKAAVQYAKTQAIMLGHPVFLTSSDPSLNWSKGMTLNHFNSHSNKTEMIYQWEWHHRHWRIQWAGINSAKSLVFSNNPISAISNGRFIITNLRNQDHLEIILNRLGRMRIGE